MLNAHVRLYIPRAWAMSMNLLFLVIDLLVSSLLINMRIFICARSHLFSDTSGIHILMNIRVGIRLGFYRQSVDD